VITGTAKGVRLVAPGSGTRPLSDRVKQTLFASLGSALGDDWPGPFLDLFAGSGAAGIEALSRGAPRAVFVERDPAATKVIAENLRRTRLEGGQVVQRDVAAFLRDGPAAAGAPFIGVLVDPPYADSARLDEALAALGAPDAGWLSSGAVVVAKHFWRDEPAGSFGDLSVARRRRFGETALTYYRHR
jgi:16S rRNA (guanine966-N2)-methyltransferase